MITFKDFFGKEHTITSCTEQDIDVHFALIKDVIPVDEITQFKERMAECIEAGSAYTISSDCFLYYLNYKPCCANGVALYGKNSPSKLLTLFAGIFSQLDTHTFKLNFKLHAGKMVQEYKSIITLTSLKRQRIKGYPLVIRIDKLKNKITAIYNKRGLL